MAPCLKPTQVAHPHFSQGETAGRDGQGRPRGLRGCASWPRTHYPCAEADLAASPSRARLGQERAHSRAWQGEQQLHGYRKGGPPATCRQPPPASYLQLVSGHLKVEKAASAYAARLLPSATQGTTASAIGASSANQLYPRPVPAGVRCIGFINTGLR